MRKLCHNKFMAKIYFYDTTDIDKRQIRHNLKDTEHTWEFIDEKISLDNIHDDAEVLSPFVSSTITAEIIEKLPKLKLIACRSTGFNNVDLKAASKHGVVVANVPSYGEQTVAEYTFALILSLSRKLPESISVDQRTRPSVKDLQGFDLQGKTIGVIGTGRIGLKAVQIARGFAMKILAYDPYPNQAAAEEYGMKYVELDELLTKSDVVSLHVPYMPSTHHMINAEMIDKMKKSAIIVNTARGELINTEDLVIALNERRIAGAALDVLEGEALWHLDDNVEMLRNDSQTHQDSQHMLEQLALSKMPNVIITPHNAYNTAEAIGRINGTACQNIADFFAGTISNQVK